MDTTNTTFGKVFLLQTIPTNKCANFAHTFPKNFVTFTPPGSYIVYLLLIIGPAAGGGGIEGEQKITIILVLLFARLQLRMQLRCMRTECVENFCYFVLYS